MFLIRFLAGNIFCGLLICVISGIKRLLGDRLTRRYHYYIWFVLLISLCVVLLPDSLFKAVGFSSFPMPGQSAAAAAAGGTATLSGASGWMQDFSQSVSRADSGRLMDHSNLGMRRPTLRHGLPGRRPSAALAEKRFLQPDPALSPALKECQSVIPCHGRVKLRQSRGIKGPLTFGLFTHYIVLPESTTQQLTLAEVKNILLHELCHIKNKDIFLNHLMCALRPFTGLTLLSGTPFPGCTVTGSFSVTILSWRDFPAKKNA